MSDPTNSVAVKLEAWQIALWAEQLPAPGCVTPKTVALLPGRSGLQGRARLCGGAV
jgi:hypothetical protein